MPDKGYPGKTRILILNFVTLRWGFLFIVWLSVLSFIITMYTKKQKKRLYRRSYNSKNFNPGLALTGFRTILLCFQQVNLRWALNKKAALGQRSTSKKTTRPRWIVTWARDMVKWYWSADTLLWQVSIDHNMDVQYQRSTRLTQAPCLCQPIIGSIATMLRDSVVVVAVVRTHAHEQSH